MATSRIIGNEDDGHIRAVPAALDGASEIIVISGFATQDGFKLIKSEVKRCLDDDGRVTLVLGVDQRGITSAKLVKTLGRLLRRYEEQLKVTLIFEQRGREFLHAKVYWGERNGSMDANVVVGSANLTAQAFQTNYELSLADSGSLHEHKKRLLAFVGSLRNAKKLTAKNAKKLAKKMQVSSPSRPQEKSSKSNRETKAGTERNKALRESLGDAQVPVWGSTKTWDGYATDFVNEGILLVNNIDFGDMTISPGLNPFFEKGILPKFEHSTVGTAELRQAAPVARISFLPADLSRRITAMQRKAGRRLTKSGFKTPFGVWVPKPMVKSVHEGVHADFRDLPATTELERAIEGELEKHRKYLTQTVKAIVAQVANGGICPPADWKWKRPPKELQDIQRSYGNDRKGWTKGNSAYDKTLNYIRKALLEKLDTNLKSDICVSKVRRLKPRLMRVPATIESDRISLATFLGEVAWQVAEHLQAKRLRPGKRQTRDAVVHLSERLSAGFVEQPEALAELSSKLLDSNELVENAHYFFKAFGPPPYWLPILESHEVPGLLSATESDFSSLRFRFHGDASETAQYLEYDPDDCNNVVFWMAEQDERGFSHTELAERVGEEEWEDCTPEEAAYWILEQLVERRELQPI